MCYISLSLSLSLSLCVYIYIERFITIIIIIIIIIISGCSIVLSLSYQTFNMWRLITHGSFPIGLISNWARFYLGSIMIAFLPNDLPNLKWQAVKQHLDDHVGAELETSRVYIWWFHTILYYGILYHTIICYFMIY